MLGLLLPRDPLPYLNSNKTNTISSPAGQPALNAQTMCLAFRLFLSSGGGGGGYYACPLIFLCFFFLFSLCVFFFGGGGGARCTPQCSLRTPPPPPRGDYFRLCRLTCSTSSKTLDYRILQYH